MISVDISNIWGAVSLPDLLAMENQVAAAHEAMMNDDGSNWLETSSRESNPELFRILLAAERIRSDSEVCVIVGVGGCVLGSRAAIELLQGPNHNLGKGKGDPQILFTGDNFSTRHRNELLGLLKDKDFSVIVISKEDMAMESGIAFRCLRWMLERKYGTDEANRRIYAVTDPEKGALRQMVQEARWESFSIPEEVSENHCVLTAAGLLPMAVAGLDIREVLAGAAAAREEYAMGSFENPVWLYTAVRNLLYRGGKAVEILAAFEPGFSMFGRWWQQLFANAEGKDGKGLFPATAELSADLHVLGQLIQEGQRNLFETMVRFAPPENKLTIDSDWKNYDGLNYLEGRTLDEVDEGAYQAVLQAHVDGGVPVITMDCGELKERTLGEMICFWELCCGISAFLLGVDPFERSGLETYQQNLFRFLGKPENHQ